MRLALQTLALLASGTLVGVAANALSPRPAALGAEVRSSAEASGMCAAPAPAGPPPDLFAVPPAPAFAPPAAGGAPFAPAPPPAFRPEPAPAAAPPHPDCPQGAMFAGGEGTCSTCHRPRSPGVLR